MIQLSFDYFGSDSPPSPTSCNVAQEIKSLGGDNASALNADDIADFSDAEKRIIKLMDNGQWFTDLQVIHASCQREGLRRLRNLRKKGYTVETRRIFGTAPRRYEYRLTKN
jgi:hypothetical protein